ncbi:MAG: hypothetical protein E3J72_11740 [Planctomycetota bacterium]|nr:MAG: hypothetical protein E3J72_11740 [Planctomycetota bacterium]
MKCESVKKLIDKLVYELLDEETANGVRTHCESCHPCAQDLEAAKTRKNSFFLWKLAAPARDLTRAVMERVRNIPPPVRRRIASWTFRLTAAAAVLVIGFFTIYVAVIHGGAPSPENLSVAAPSMWTPAANIGLMFRFVDTKSGKPIANAELAAELLTRDGKKISLIRTVTDSRGRAAGTCKVPDVPEGKYCLVVEATKSDGSVERIKRPVMLRRSFCVFVRTDKPLYRPGDAVKTRAVVLDRQTSRPVAEKPVRFILSAPYAKDRQGYKPLAETMKAETSRFGVANVEFPSEALKGGNNSSVHLTVDVDGEQTLVRMPVSPDPAPTLRIDCKTDKPYYTEGEKVNALITVQSLKGEPVDSLSVKIEVDGVDFKSVGRRVPASGTLPLPAFTLGNRGATIIITAGPGLKDPAARFPITFAKTPVSFWRLPGPGLLKGAKNIMYVLARKPDGTPAVNLEFTVRETGEKIKTDRAGLAVIAIPAGTLKLTFTGSIDNGPFKVETDLERFQRDFIVRTERGSYGEGEMVRAIVETSPGTGDDFYVCLVRAGQVVAAVPSVKDTKAGHSFAELSIPAGVRGLLRVRAFRMNTGKIDKGATSAIYVYPQKGLNLTSKTEKEHYSAGSGGKVRVIITAYDRNGKPLVIAVPAEATDAGLFEYVRRAGTAKNALFGGRFQITGPAEPLAEPGRMFPTDKNAASALLSQETRITAPVFEHISSASVKAQKRRMALLSMANRFIPFRFILMACIFFALGALLLLRNFVRLATGSDAQAITLTRQLGIAIAAFIPCALAWHLGWGYAAGGGDPVVQALAHVLVPVGVILAATVILAILRRGADSEGAYNPVLFEAGALLGVYQLVAIFLPWRGAFAFRMDYLPLIAAALVFFGGSILAVIRVRPQKTSGRSFALRAAGILGPAVATAIILAVALLPVKTIPPQPPTIAVSPIHTFQGESLYWNPMLVTDENGQATAEFDVPNHAGTWVFHADGISPDGKLSAISTEIKVTRNKTSDK